MSYMKRLLEEMGEPPNKMIATISRQYREGNWSIYSEDIDHHWQEFLDKVPFEFDKDNENHRWYANGFIQALFGSDAKISLRF